ncbi:MAG: Co2+/Mg2+ efflux protein ApaG [Gammaproteobacteria bacterium]|nr:Co2+/Mg2+ efflux protein ApaG [Pseudomonadota bacterium]MDG2302026.1 Co2+/Mg2+ efflux protein ApaG [Gammaproteobacteria bacterium]MBT5065133.1 Co2+/Mg2+ efflux protein ApaG [Pseudomonadota bacterium]MBT6193607.1 Co2+/Mg2+ efflux protein ApaG [Pseudomonadota bacterium]MBT6465741.1 Co2+/Mg2+ efflux protein ApaG [Pseudomonadota bacterium]
MLQEPKGKIIYQISVNGVSNYLEAQSDPGASRYVFAYTITLTNTGEIAARLEDRHWIIIDGEGATQEVRGRGVVGKEPLLEPGEIFTYSSASQISTVFGTMNGSYGMLASDGTRFKAPVPSFHLAIPNALH